MSANLAVLSRDKNQLRIPKVTPTGEVLLFVDLAQVSNYTPEQVAELVTSIGYMPELRIAEYFRNGQSVLEPVLLIHQGKSPVDQVLLNDWQNLARLIHPPTAVHLRSGQPLAL